MERHSSLQRVQTGAMEAHVQRPLASLGHSNKWPRLGGSKQHLFFRGSGGQTLEITVWQCRAVLEAPSCPFQPLGAGVPGPVAARLHLCPVFVRLPPCAPAAKLPLLVETPSWEQGPRNPGRPRLEPMVFPSRAARTSARGQDAGRAC